MTPRLARSSPRARRPRQSWPGALHLSGGPRCKLVQLQLPASTSSALAGSARIGHTRLASPCKLRTQCPPPISIGAKAAGRVQKAASSEITASCVSSCKAGCLVFSAPRRYGSHSSPGIAPAPWGLDAAVKLPAPACCSKRCSTFLTPPAGGLTSLAVVWANAAVSCCGTASGTVA